MTIPKVGDYLYASCSAETYGPVLRVGKDANGEDVLDIRLPLNDFITYRTDGDTQPTWHDKYQTAMVKNDPSLGIMADKLEELGFDVADLRALIGGTVLFKDLLWKSAEWVTEPAINLCTPKGGCYRCTELFWIKEGPSVIKYDAMLTGMMHDAMQELDELDTR